MEQVIGQVVFYFSLLIAILSFLATFIGRIITKRKAKGETLSAHEILEIYYSVLPQLMQDVESVFPPASGALKSDIVQLRLRDKLKDLNIAYDADAVKGFIEAYIEASKKLNATPNKPEETTLEPLKPNVID